MPGIYDRSTINGPDELDGPFRTRAWSPCPDGPFMSEFLLGSLWDRFVMLSFNVDGPESIAEDGISAFRIEVADRHDPNGVLRKRHLGEAPQGNYLIRPDQHVAARWPDINEESMRFALRKATGKE